MTNLAPLAYGIRSRRRMSLPPSRLVVQGLSLREASRDATIGIDTATSDSLLCDTEETLFDADVAIETVFSAKMSR